MPTPRAKIAMNDHEQSRQRGGGHQSQVCARSEDSHERPRTIKATRRGAPIPSVRAERAQARPGPTRSFSTEREQPSESQSQLELVLEDLRGEGLHNRLGRASLDEDLLAEHHLL